MPPILRTLAALAALAASVAAISVKDLPGRNSIARVVGDDAFDGDFAITAAASANSTVPTMGNSTFQQLIDHEQPWLGTFSQFYFYSDEHYAGPGSPVCRCIRNAPSVALTHNPQVILFTPGEINATRYTSYLTTKRITGTFAQALGAAVIVLEHRYWGVSSPFDDLSTKNLQYLTLSNSIADLTHFARTAKLPFDLNGTSQAPNAPWLLTGGSYSGSLAAWTATTAPGTFWAYTATSAPVEAISDFWQYFEPVQLGMPQNCSKDVSLVIDYMDNVLEHGTAAEQLALKEMFGVGGVQHNDDFMAFIENLPWAWQGNQFYTNTGFFTACDYVENANTNGSSIPGAEGVGLEKALAGYAKWVNSTLLPGYCAGFGYTEDQYDISCLDTYNASNPLYTDHTLSNTADRQWVWFLCNEPFGWWQDGAPTSRPSLVSRLVTAEYW